MTVLALVAALLQVAPTVTDMSPAPGGVQSSPASIIVTLDAAIDPSTVTAASVTVVGAGPDAAFGTGDDVAIIPGSIGVSGSVLTLDLSAQVLPDGLYRVRLSGTPNTPATHAGLFGYWKLNEGSGTQALDSSGNGHVGTLNGATWSPGLFGNALRLNGETTGVDLNAGILPPNWTFALWVNRTADVVGTAATILDAAFGVNGTSVRMQQYADGQVGMTEYTVVDEGFGYTAPIGPWIHLAFSSDGTNARLHVDGVLVHTSPRAYNLHVTKLGSVSTILTHSMIGLLNEAQVYTRVLTGPEIASLATLAGCVRSATGEVLNGEFSGTFPTGNSSAGGDFTATFTVAASPPGTPPRVVAMAPAPGSAGRARPRSPLPWTSRSTPPPPRPRRFGSSEPGRTEPSARATTSSFSHRGKRRERQSDRH